MARTHSTPLNHPRVRWSRLKIYWPVLVWIAAVFAFVATTMRNLHSTMFMGVAENQIYEIQTNEQLLVHHVSKRKGDRVAPNELLLELDTTGLKVERATILHEISEDNKTREEERQRWQRELSLVQHETLRRIAELAAEIASLTSEIPLMLQEQSRVRPLVEQRLLTPDILSELDIRIASTNARLEMLPGIQKTLEMTLDWTRQQLDDLQKIPEQPFPSDNHPAIQGLDWRIANTQLRAPTAGYVTEVLARPGTLPQNNVPLMRISGTSTRRIVGFIPETIAHTVNTGRVFHVQSIASGSLIGSATIITLMPDIVELPRESMLLASRLVRGRYAVLEMNEEIDLLPGQLVVLLTHANARDKWNAFRERLRIL